MGFFSWLFSHPNDYRTLEGDFAFKVVGRLDSMNMYILNSAKPCSTKMKKSKTYLLPHTYTKKEIEGESTVSVFGIPILTVQKVRQVVVDDSYRSVKQYVEMTDEMSDLQDVISTLVSSTKEIHRTNRLYTQRGNLEENMEVQVVPKIIETRDSYILGWKMATV